MLLLKSQNLTLAHSYWKRKLTCRTETWPAYRQTPQTASSRHWRSCKWVKEATSRRESPLWPSWACRRSQTDCASTSISSRWRRRSGGRRARRRCCTQPGAGSAWSFPCRCSWSCCCWWRRTWNCWRRRTPWGLQSWETRPSPSGGSWTHKASSHSAGQMKRIKQHPKIYKKTATVILVLKKNRPFCS